MSRGAAQAFLAAAGWAAAARRPLAGDASTRRYEALVRPDGAQAIFMDAYSGRLQGKAGADDARYADRVKLAPGCGAFAAIGLWLRAQGLSAPALLALDVEQGFLLLEDLGRLSYGAALSGAQNFADPRELLETALEVLIRLAQSPAPAALPLPGGAEHKPALFGEDIFLAELGLFTNWFCPAAARPPGAAAKAQFDEAARRQYAALAQAQGAPVLMLRDYHSPNLLWLPERKGAARTGLLDFQDALIGPAAYDLVSLLQDARVAIDAQLEEEMRDLYLDKCARAGLGIESGNFLRAYAILGAQRALRILGIFIRLARRDGKRVYLRHLPRVAACLERNLAHEVCAPFRRWLEMHMPEGIGAQIKQVTG